MKKLLSFVFTTFIFAFSVFAQAYNFKFSLEPLYSFCNGSLYEYVLAWDENSSSYVKMSELDWPLESLSLIGTRATFDWNYVRLSGQFLGGIPKNSGTMEDYDWLDYTQSGTKIYYTNSQMLTNKSLSQNYLNSAFLADLKVEGKFNPWKNLMVNPYLSLDYSYFSFSASDAYGWYGDTEHTADLGYNVSYDDTNASYMPKGTLNGIDYEKNTLNIFTGLSLGWKFKNRLLLSAYGAFSPFNYIQSLDFHHYDSEGKTGTYYQDIILDVFKSFECGAYLEANIYKSFSLDLSFDFQIQNLARGITYQSTQKSMKVKQASVTSSGAKAQFWRVNFGAKWTF